MNGFPEVNGMTERNQESQENTLCNEKQNTAGTGTPVTTIEPEVVPGNKGCAGRTPEQIAIDGSVSGTAEMTGAWGE